MKTRCKISLALFAGFATAGVVAQSPALRFPDRTGHPPALRPGEDDHRPPPTPPQFGDPLPGLTHEQRSAFNLGLKQFKEVDTVANGLGPIFNDVSCAACHAQPAIGGASTTNETRFGRMVNGKFDPLTAWGGSLLQKKAIDPACLETVPSVANVIAQRHTTPLFGAGLIEAIPDDVIKALAQRPPVDGIAGRPSVVFDVASGTQRVGRFGWKAQQATLLAFSGDAYVNEIGITNRLFPSENAPNGNVALLAQYDHVADPEDQTDPATGKADVDRFTDFMRFLAPPPPKPPTPVAEAGRVLFHRLQCAVCHQPSLNTGPNPIPALNWRPVPLYSDLLLHDMGSLGDGIAQAAAGPTEMRTAPLWGLRVRAPYLHDGRAATVDAAIRLHDGEARSARDRYTQLNCKQQQALLDFLNSL